MPLSGGRPASIQRARFSWPPLGSAVAGAAKAGRQAGQAGQPFKRLADAAAMASRSLGWRLAFTLRASWPAMALGLLGGFLAQAVLPLAGAWLAGAVAAGCALASAACLLAGSAWERKADRPVPDARGLPAEAVLERSNAAQQVGHALGMAALALAAFAAGSGAASLAGL